VSVTTGPNYLLGEWDNVVVARFPDEHSSSASSAIAAFFVISSVCSVLWPTFFFAYRWNLFALLLVAGDIACHCFTFLPSSMSSAAAAPPRSSTSATPPSTWRSSCPSSSPSS
jgi:hypothetical protein